MKQYTFSTFLVDDSNRAVFQLCEAIANLQPGISLPVTLLADKGNGKTHMLYSIVNRVRAGSARTGLAYVTANDFPDQVRALISDPSPVERAESAILLVDQLDLFDNSVEDLEEVVRIFLDNNHYVVLASSVHPGRLQNITDGLKNIILSGQVLEITPKGADIREELIKRQESKASEGIVKKQQAKIDQLRAELGAVKESTAETANLNAQLEQERNANDDLRKEVELAKAKSESLQGLLDAMEQDKEQKKDDVSSQELEAARAEAQAALFQLDELREQRDQAKVELAKLQAREGLLASEREDFESQLNEANTLRVAVESQLEDANKKLGGHEKEMDALKHEAAEQVALANAQAGELEGAVSRFKAAIEQSHETELIASTELQRLKQQFQGAADILENLSNQLSAASNGLVQDRFSFDFPEYSAPPENDVREDAETSDQTDGSDGADKSDLMEAINFEPPELENIGNVETTITDVDPRSQAVQVHEIELDEPGPLEDNAI